MSCNRVFPGAVSKVSRRAHAWRMGGCFLLALCGSVPDLRAQAARDTVVELSAAVQTSTPVITLQWNSVAVTTALEVYRRDKGAALWGTAVATPGAAATSFADSNAVAGVAYEYMVRRTRSAAPTFAYGTIVAGCDVPLVDDRGRVVLIVDQTMALPLGQEIERLQSDMAGDGWSVIATNVPRMVVSPSSTNVTDYATRRSELDAVRAIVQAKYAEDPARTRSVFLLGRPPVPYSGYIAPDGHGNHSGAWPADGFYGDVNDVWTDGSSSDTSASDRRNWNVPGDGKFDRATIPGTNELAVGRVDMANMTSVPVGMGETALLRQYLNRDHDFRHVRGPYASVPRRALIDDNFGYFYGEAFAASGWRNGLTFFGPGAGMVNALDWFTTLGTDKYLLGYGCGGGSFTSASGVGTSTYDFSRRDSQAVFTMLFGSYFGDWDITDNFLRAPLAGTANSLGLTCAWSGRGYFHFDHMAMGETVGYGHLLTQNNPVYLSSGGWQGNSYAKYVTYNLMGDPTLRLHPVPVPRRPSSSVSSGQIALSWQAPGDPTVTRYHVYRGESPGGPFTRLTGAAATAADPMGSPITATSFADTTVVPGTTYTYLVKSVRMETSASGTYANSSQGAVVTAVADPATAGPAAPTGLAVAGLGGGIFVLSWEDNAGDETGFEVQRRDPTTGAWSTIAAPAADSTSHTDGAAPDGQVVHYRVRATGSTGNSAYCEAAADSGTRGLVSFNPDAFLVDKSAGTANVPALRWNGSQGQVGVNYSISNITATNGVHYTAVTGSLVWTNSEGGTKTVPVPVASVAGQQVTRVFRVNLSSPTGGVALTSLATNYVFIGDATSQSVPSPWTGGIVGSLLTTGYVEHASGTFGALCRSADIGGTADTCRFIYRNAAADMRLTCRVASFPTTSSGSAKAGIMVRSNLTANVACFNSMIEAGRTGRRIYRTSVGGTADNAATQASLSFPCWLRVTRSNDVFAAQWSTNGTAWGDLGTALSIPAMGGTPVVGLAVASNNDPGWAVPACASFDSVNLELAPEAPSSVAAAYGRSSDQILIGWWTVEGTTAYHIERALAAGGPFTEIAVLSHPEAAYTDTGRDPAVTYYYRVRGESSGLFGLYTPVVSGRSTPYPIANWRKASFGSSANSGPGANDADTDLDGRSNLEEYAFATNPKVHNPDSPIKQDTSPGGGLAVEFDRVPARNDIDLVVERSDDLANWNEVARSTAGGACISSDPGWTVNESGTGVVRVRVSQTVADPPEFVRVRVVSQN